MAEYHAQAAASAKAPKKPSMKLRKQKLLSFLQGMVVLQIFSYPPSGIHLLLGSG